MAGNTKSKCLIVTSADANFLPAACCMVISATTTLAADDDVSLMLLAVDVSEKETIEANDFLEKHGVAPCVRKVSSDALLDSRLRTNKRISKASYIRLALGKLVASDIDRVLYIDADTRVLSEVAPLLATDMQGFPLAAVHDLKLYQGDLLERTCRRLAMPETADYFNAGVLLFDWPHTLRCGLLDRAMEFACSNPDLCLKHDQDALNVAATGNWRPLDPRWNLFDYYFVHAGKHTAWIKHFTGSKPWSCRRPQLWKQDAEWMKELLANSPWPEYVERQSWLDRLRITLKAQRKKIARNLQLAGYYVVPFAMSPRAKQRAREYLQQQPELVEKLITDLIRHSKA